MIPLHRFGIVSLPMLLIACEKNQAHEQDTPEPNIEVNVDEVNFGNLLLGSLSTESIKIKNSGEVTLVVQSISALPPFTSPSGGGFELEPGTETNITIQFIPTSYQEVSGSLTIVSSDPDEPQLTVPILGATISDVDGDGFDTVDAGGDDCDDDDANVYPGAPDEWYDGVDSNCQNDDDYDQDGDGYQTMVWNDDPDLGGGDCQDNNAEMFPAHQTNGMTVSTQTVKAMMTLTKMVTAVVLNYTVGLDCNDLDAQINSNGTEAINGLDDDCDGDVDYPVPAWNPIVSWKERPQMIKQVGL